MVVGWGSVQPFSNGEPMVLRCLKHIIKEGGEEVGDMGRVGPNIEERGWR